MSIAPVNFYSCLELVPVFRWEPVDSQEGTTETPAPPVNSEGGSVDAQPPITPDPDTDTPATAKLKLVFKGFEWVFTPGVATFPRPDWMDGITAGSTQDADDDRRRRFDAAKLARMAAAHAPPQPHVPGGEEAGSAATDTGATE
jgi:hypothetical protein